MYRTVFALVVLAALPAWASEPGEPIDCSDWVALQPGYACTSGPCGECSAGLEVQVDNQGYTLRIVKGAVGFPGDECSNDLTIPVWRVQRLGPSGVAELVGYLPEFRCNGLDPFGYSMWDKLVARRDLTDLGLINRAGFRFDDKNGRVSIPMTSTCNYDEDSVSPQCLYGNNWIVTIEGFTTTFDILQTYTPTSGPISFRVPYMPEGMEAADWFDTYVGDLATVGDWSQAQGLQCSYPAAAPSVGDYLTVADTLPTPSPGQGYYYFTSATYQGETRYGRRTSGGVKSGRDPAVLPGCAGGGNNVD